jgi:hypothetical protein
MNLTMKVMLLVAAKFSLIFLAIYYFYDPASQSLSHPTAPVCFDTSTPHTLCAHCLSRDSSTLHRKGYHIVSTGSSSVLKIAREEEMLSCDELLQLVDFQKDYVGGEDYHLENIEPVNQLLGELKAKFSFKKTDFSQSEYTVEPWYRHFVVYKWKAAGGSSEVSVKSVNPDFYQGVQTSLMYIFNFVLLVVLVAWLADSSFITELSPPLKLALTGVAICLELSLLGIWAWGFHFVARLLVFNLGLLKLRVNNFKVIAYLGAGLLMTYFPLTRCIYNGLITILVVYYGKDQPETRSVKLYLAIFYTLLLMNYSYWYQYVLYLNDIPSLIIEFCALVFVPTGIFLLPNEKEGVRYNPADPEIRSISLAGFEEDEEGHL